MRFRWWMIPLGAAVLLVLTLFVFIARTPESELLTAYRNVRKGGPIGQLKNLPFDFKAGPDYASLEDLRSFLKKDLKHRTFTGYVLLQDAYNTESTQFIELRFRNGKRVGRTESGKRDKEQSAYDRLVASRTLEEIVERTPKTLRARIATEDQNPHRVRFPADLAKLARFRGKIDTHKSDNISFEYLEFTLADGVVSDKYYNMKVDY